MTTESQIIDWFCSNNPAISVILSDLNKAKSKLLEMEPVVFHDDIEAEFNDLAFQKIIDLITFDLAIPAEMVYNTIGDKDLLIQRLNQGRL